MASPPLDFSKLYCCYTYVDPSLEVPSYQVGGGVYETRSQAIEFLKSEDGIPALVDVDPAAFVFKAGPVRLPAAPNLWRNGMTHHAGAAAALQAEFQLLVEIKSEDEGLGKRKREEVKGEEATGRMGEGREEQDGRPRRSGSSSQAAEGPSAKREEAPPAIPPPAPSTVASPPPAPPSLRHSGSASTFADDASQAEAGPSNSSRNQSHDDSPAKPSTFLLHIKSSEEDDIPLVFNVRPTSSLHKVALTYATKRDLDASTLRLTFEDFVMPPGWSVEEAGLTDGSVLVAVEVDAEA